MQVEAPKSTPNAGNPEPPPKNRQRLHSLDALRGFCMLFGVFVHGYLLVLAFPQFQIFPETSTYFRMATFFAVSGLLGSLVLSRQTTGTYIRGRLMAVLIPFASALVILNPVTLWMMDSYRGGDASLLEAVQSSMQSDRENIKVVWHLHLWFLLSLAVFALLAPLIRRGLTRSTSVVERTLGAINPTLRGFAVAALVTGVGLAMRVLGEVVAPWMYDAWLLRATLIYLPFFVLGIAIERVPSLRALTRSANLPLTGVAIALILAVEFVEIPLPENAVRLVGLSVLFFANTSAVLLLMSLFERVLSTKNRLVELVVQSIYTIYLFHFLLLFVLGSGLRSLGLDGAVLFWATTLGTISVGFALHHMVITRFRMLTFLFNGKRLA